MPQTRQLIQRAASPRRKINLAHKRRSSSEKIWYIGKRQSGHIYYLADFDDDRSTALWSKYKKDGMKFKTEAGVYQYISTYLNNRNDVMLIQAGS